MKMLMQHVHAQPVPPSQRTELPIPRELDDLVLACLQKDPAKRPQNAGELLNLAYGCRCSDEWGQDEARHWWQAHLPDLTGSLTVATRRDRTQARRLGVASGPWPRAHHSPSGEKSGCSIARCRCSPKFEPAKASARCCSPPTSSTCWRSTQVLKIVRDALILSESGARGCQLRLGRHGVGRFSSSSPVYGALASRVNRVWLISRRHAVLRVPPADSSSRSVRPASDDRHRVLHLGRRVQHGRSRPVLGIRQRPLHHRAREAPVPARRHRRLARRPGRRRAHRVFFEGIGPYSLMLIAAFGLLVPVALTIIVHRRERAAPRPQRPRRPRQARRRTRRLRAGVQQRYLLLIAMLVLVLNLVNTLGGFMLNTLIEQEARAAASPPGATGGQTRRPPSSAAVRHRADLRQPAGARAPGVPVSRIFKYIGVRGALFILPVIAAQRIRVDCARFQCSRRPVGRRFREQHRLLDPEHHAPRPVPADQPRGQVQGEAGDRLLLRALRRHAAGCRGVRRRSTGPERPRASPSSTWRSWAIWFLIVFGIRREHRKLTGTEKRSTERVVPGPGPPRPQSLVRGDVLRFRYNSVTCPTSE